MTLLIATVDQDVGYLSQDSFYQAAPDDSALKRRWLPVVARFAPAAMRPRSCGGHIEAVVGGYNAAKIQQFPRARMTIATSSGTMFAITHDAIARCCRDIDHFSALLPKVWKHLPGFIRGEFALIIAIGWSQERGRVVGYGATTDGEMRPELLESGTAQCPNDVADGPHAKEIAMLSARLGSEAEIERLHKLTAINTAWAAVRGRYDCRQISGPITMAKVTRQGINIKEIARIDSQQSGAAA